LRVKLKDINIVGKNRLKSTNNITHRRLLELMDGGRGVKNPLQRICELRNHDIALGVSGVCRGMTLGSKAPGSESNRSSGCCIIAQINECE
jgi:hypothetical protein